MLGAGVGTGPQAPSQNLLEFAEKFGLIFQINFWIFFNRWSAKRSNNFWLITLSSNLAVSSLGGIGRQR